MGMQTTNMSAIKMRMKPVQKNMAELMNEASICGGAYHKNDLPLERAKRERKAKRKRKKR